MQDERTQDVVRAQRTFLVLWAVVTAIKVVIAARLPLFVDEAFYWQEGQHLAAAYSDLPGLSAWLTRLGTAIGGDHVLALRAPFLLLAALLPWLMTHIAGRWFGEAAGWRAGSLAVLMPLAGSLGILALPDVPMALATVLCLDAGARLLREVDAASAAELAIGLTIGALSHYRFIGVIGVGMVALLLLPQGRRILRDPRVWVALAVGIAAWAPLVAWNLENSDAGLRFQLLDRHPWAFHSTGWWFLVVQAALVTPLLFCALVQVFVRSFRGGDGMPAQWRYFGLLGGVSTVGFFVLGFFADVERVSFHWPLAGYLPLLIAVPALLREWPRGWRLAAWISTGAGLLVVLGYYLVLATPQWREHFAADKFYPANFAGWDVLADAVREEMASSPPGTTLLADNFKSGAELGFALGNPRIPVLDHPLNVVNVDHGSQRFLLFAMPAERIPGPCTLPAFAWIDAPASQGVVGRRFQVSGWAFKDGVGLRAVQVLLDGKPVADARYGLPSPGTAGYWKISTDPNHPDVGFEAQVDLESVAPGRHWLGLRLQASDGSVEDWAEQPLDLR
ncbi:MAG: glycosyltransferase family 39 protein [Sphingomonadales bacterium]|nr:MAG: glycosyltransferase family 39 protein [Sphingomonadales bacterium]